MSRFNQKRMSKIKVIDKYLSDKADPEYTFALNLIRRGICFVVDNSTGQNRFYPSRFIGYTSNSMNKHQNNEQKDGRVTNKALAKIFGEKPKPNPELEKSYIEYCESFGIIAREKGTYGTQRKFWTL